MVFLNPRVMSATTDRPNNPIIIPGVKGLVRELLVRELPKMPLPICVVQDFLQEMNSENVAPWSPEDMASFLPMSLVAGWCCILELDTLFPGSSIVPWLIE